MDTLEKILKEIEKRMNMVKNIPVDENDDFWMVRNVMKPEGYKVGMKSWYGVEI